MLILLSTLMHRVAAPGVEIFNKSFNKWSLVTVQPYGDKGKATHGHWLDRIK
jgi:hypothetical protein